MINNSSDRKHPSSVSPHASRRLGVRLVRMTLLVTGIASLLVSAVLLWLDYRQQVRHSTERFNEIQQSYLPSLATALWQVDQNQVNALLTGITQLPNVGVVELTDETHHVSLLRAEDLGNAITEQRFPLHYREAAGEYPVGELKVTLHDRSIISQLKQRAVSILTTTIATLLVGAVLFLWLFQTWVARHLQRMAQHAAELRLDALGTPLTLNRPLPDIPDELELVVRSLNAMQNQMEQDLALQMKMELELREHREQLEFTVQQRTKELSEKSALLKSYAQELEAQNQELNAYAHTVAHDLKSPLTALIGASDLLQHAQADLNQEQINDLLLAVQRSARKMHTIVDALLLLASVRRSDEVVAEPLDMHQLAREACARLQHHAMEKMATIEFVGPFPSAMGHPTWVEEVWVNYLSNAIKYGGKQPHIELGCTMGENGNLKFWVRDHGQGVPLGKRDKLFIQFSRMEKHDVEGHGLGLSIVKRIVNRLDGEVGHENTPGGGSTFWFSLRSAST